MVNLQDLELKNKIENFLFVEGFKPYTYRTSVVLEYIIVALTSEEPYKVDIISALAKKFETKNLNIIQLLFQAKTSYEKNNGLDHLSMTPKDFMYLLIDKFKKSNNQ